MATYQAYIQPAPGAPLSLQSVETPQPTVGQILVEVLASPISSNAGDLLAGKLFPLTHPFAPGASAIGRIAAIGPDATRLKRDQLVYCCSFVRARDDVSGSTWIIQGLFPGPTPEAKKLMEGPWRYGAWAKKVLVPTEMVTPLNETTLLQDLGYTVPQLCWINILLVPYGGWLTIGLSVGETVIVAPATGCFGSAAVHMALALGARRVIAAGRNKDSLQRVAQLYGADKVSIVALTGDVQADTQALKAASPGGEGADVYMDFMPPEAPGATHPQACIAALKYGGRVILEGGLVGQLSMNYIHLVANNITVKGNLMYGSDAPSKLVRLVESGLLDLKAPDTKTFEFEDLEKGVKAAADIKGPGRLTVLKVR